MVVLLLPQLFLVKLFNKKMLPPGLFTVSFNHLLQYCFVTLTNANYSPFCLCSLYSNFIGIQGSPMAVSDRTWDRLVEADVGSSNNRLYGGSQYHRSLREFSLAVKCLRTPSIAEDEIANAVGVGDTHDGVNFLQAACVIALEKARTSFEPMLGTLMMRMSHVMGRLCPVTEYMLRESRDRGKVTNYRQGIAKKESDSKLNEVENAMDISQNPQFRELIRTIFENFVQDCADNVSLQHCLPGFCYV